MSLLHILSAVCFLRGLCLFGCFSSCLVESCFEKKCSQQGLWIILKSYIYVRGIHIIQCCGPHNLERFSGYEVIVSVLSSAT